MRASGSKSVSKSVSKAVAMEMLELRQLMSVAVTGSVTLDESSGRTRGFVLVRAP